MFAPLTNLFNQSAFSKLSTRYHLRNIPFVVDPPAKFILFDLVRSGDAFTPHISTSEFLSPKGQLFRFRLWYFMYGQDDGDLVVHISEASTSSIWSTMSRDVRNWQFQQIEMKAASSFSVSFSK